MTDMVKLGELIQSSGPKVGDDGVHYPVYSVTKHAGFVPSLEYFNKQVFSRDQSGYRLVKQGEFAYATIHLDEGSIGIAPEDALISPMYTVFSVDEKRVNKNYLLYLLKSPWAISMYSILGRGAIHRRMAISLKSLGNLQIPLPSLDEQRRIVEILDRADAIRAKRRHMLADFDELKGSVYLDMFNDDDIEKRSFGELFNVRSGQFLPAKSQHDGPYAVYGGNGINGRHDRYTLEKPEIVIGRVGANCGAVHITEPKSWVTDNALVLSQLHDDYDMTCLAMILDKAKLNQYAAKSGQPSISMNRISTVMIPLPPISLQREFARQVEAIAAARAKVERALALDDELFASLQSRAFRGEL
ncbi:restriction endonuclease subunit S [Bifidobacterium myosotis]|uniref:Restriction endonuclease subunit S n=1 Tax=Bifidobacterium myosotis TaxID=1630166 RepID=A0A5M9ZFY1_9BIFI|nr:restriction endonuclease subunit S [Bifidobacterium myosotis]KAA8825278.1 restriction endonuclease subunit S [Bifidobacterium myosotis]